MIKKLFNTYTRKCPDGKKHTLYRNIDEALPLYITDYEGQVKTKVNVAEKVNTEVDGKFASKVSGLLYDLDSSNRNIMISFRGIYLVYKSEPCSSFELFKTQMQQIIEDHKNLKILETRIKGLIDLLQIKGAIDEVEFLTTYMDIIKDYGSYLPTESPKAKIIQARENAKKWQSKGGDDEK
jgi:hypothetical protein